MIHLERVVYEGEAAARHLLGAPDLEKEERLAAEQIVAQVHQRQVSPLQPRPQPRKKFNRRAAHLHDVKSDTKPRGKKLRRLIFGILEWCFSLKYLRDHLSCVFQPVIGVVYASFLLTITCTFLMSDLFGTYLYLYSLAD
jgi:hypothetical protein